MTDLPTSTKDSVDEDLDFSSLPSNPNVAFASLFSNTLSLHLLGLVFVVVACFAVDPHLLHPFFSVLTGTSIDPEFLHDRSLHNPSCG